MRWLAALFLFAASGAQSAPMFKSLDHGVHWLRGEFVPGRQPDGNSIVLNGRDGLIVIDSGRHPAHTQRIVEFAHHLRLPIAAIINTHWHLDHVGGNPLLKAEYPEANVYASVAIIDAMDGFLAGYRRELQAQIEASNDKAATADWQAEAAIIDSGKALFPDRPIEHASPIKLAGRALDLHLENHTVTAGDVWVYDPRSRILIAGDLVTLPVPFLDTACPSRWQAALKHIAKIRFHKLVPGHGRPMTRRQFGSYRRGFDALLACAASDAPIPQCADGWLATTDNLIADDQQAFTRQLLEYYIGQVLRSNPRRIESFCRLPSADTGGLR